MLPFKWTAARTKRLKQAVRSYNAAIDRQAKKNAAAGNETLNDSLPHKITAGEIKQQVVTANDFRRIVGYANDKKRGRPSKLDRILPSVNPGALETVVVDGVAKTRYQAKEERYNKSAKMRKRNALRKRADERAEKEGTPKLEELTAPEYAARVDGTDMRLPYEGEFDFDQEDVYISETTESQRREAAERTAWEEYHRTQVSTQYQDWLAMWKSPVNMHETTDEEGFNSVVDKIEWMYENAPDVLDEMFNDGADEMQLEFIYISPTSWGYKGLSYERRHNRVVRFVEKWYDIAVHEKEGTQ